MWPNRRQLARAAGLRRCGPQVRGPGCLDRLDKEPAVAAAALRVNNMPFLILPGERRPKLASRVLGRTCVRCRRTGRRYLGIRS